MYIICINLYIECIEHLQYAYTTEHPCAQNKEEMATAQRSTDTRIRASCVLQCATLFLCTYIYIYIFLSSHLLASLSFLYTLYARIYTILFNRLYILSSRALSSRTRRVCRTLLRTRCGFTRLCPQ